MFSPEVTYRVIQEESAILCVIQSKKSSYGHGSDFGRLWSYGHLLIPVHALVWTASYGTSWRVTYSIW